MPPWCVRISVPEALKLPLTTKSVAVLFVFLLPLVCMKAQRGGRWWDQRAFRIKIRLRGIHTRHGRVPVGSLETAKSTAGKRDGGATRTHSFVLPLIELTFCLGSIWAKLELAFLASVKFIIQRIQCVSCIPSFCSCMDQMNLTHLYISNASPPDSGPTETLRGKPFVGVKLNIRSG